MHSHNLSAWTHTHQFDTGNPGAERGARWVMWITLITMAVEIGAGWVFNSMALLADGWHMSSHALALGLSAFAYRSARRHANDTRFAFGPWKIEVLCGFASATILLGVALLMVFGSVERLLSPQPIAYGEATIVAVIGLIVNLVCALILGKSDSHGHAHGHSHGHGHGHPHGNSHGSHSSHGHEHSHHGHAHGGHGAEDLNLRSAYLHVIADAATSVLAIAALIGGWLLGWAWLDAAMGIVGAALVAVWAKGLLIQTGKVLLDREMDHPVVDEIREVVEALPGETRLSDLHVWRVGRNAFSCALSVVTHDAAVDANSVRNSLKIHEEIVHATIEVHHCG